ncbi:malto-oligosyltrehalose synthase [Nitrospira lenta]|uniref:Maltooligosyl trehalose synthase n=1 Tax=Nitrospira lenta TaxID=1436998 RepID=A0A330L6A3_9BACT|nr:malto-oligosyltrehalose synthase [Nitrospira lenta]SPP65248.1 Maltooligosyl trehalose synthase [Nitrospira lenta]
MHQTVHPRIPVSTYRIQLNRTFTFRDVAAIVPYLHDLGITDLYCSPYFTAVPGSSHGYDIVDPTRLNADIGTEEDYRVMVDALQRHDMGQLMDVVPNHMGITRQLNRWWQDVLENGPSSPYASFFDIDWDPLKSELQDKVLLPILGDQYGLVLENQELQLVYEDGRFLIRYYDHSLPVAPKPSALILLHRLDSLIRETGPHSPHVMELESIITALRHLPTRQDREPALVAERYREKEIIKRRLATLVESSATVRTFLHENVRIVNGTKGQPRSFDLLDQVLNDQAYRLAYWRVAAEEINYRRFFDINELAAIRMEDPTVFEETHKLLFRLLKEGSVTGLRIDHVDGLYDPADYLNKLQSWAKKELTVASDVTERPLYVVVEKILGVNEQLPANWPVFGTTGYDFLGWLNALFVDRANERAFDALYRRMSRRVESFEELVYRCKQLIMQVSMASELAVLGHQLDRLSERDRRSRDFTLNSLTYAIQEIIACFPVYRTYTTGDTDGILDRDRVFIWQAVAHAKRRNPAVSGLVFNFVRDLLLQSSNHAESDCDERLKFVTRFQQTTSPVTAKSVEDTAFYRYHRFVSLNEVGSSPEQFGIAPSLVHHQWESRQELRSTSLSATSTHDTKRSEDVRARLNVLSEIPKQWKEHVLRWVKINRCHKTHVGGDTIPGCNEEYLLYQTVIGVWPLAPLDEPEYACFVERIQAYMNKAVKEAKEHTSWVSPNAEYEEGIRAFIAKSLDRSIPNEFLDDFLPFQQQVAQYGLYNSLSQTLLKMVAPGVPDVYQGTELWDFSLVDPDNRRPVDFSTRVRCLTEWTRASSADADRLARAQDLFARRQDGRIKLFLSADLLRFRRAHRELFAHGRYVPLAAGGEHADHLFAFARCQGEEMVLAIVPRLITAVVPDAQTPPFGEAVWRDTWLVVPVGQEGVRFRNILTGEVVKTVLRGNKQVLSVGEIFAHYPVACLEKVA